MTFCAVSVIKIFCRKLRTFTLTGNCCTASQSAFIIHSKLRNFSLFNSRAWCGCQPEFAVFFYHYLCNASHSASCICRYRTCLICTYKPFNRLRVYISVISGKKTFIIPLIHQRKILFISRFYSAVFNSIIISIEIINNAESPHKSLAARLYT